MIVEEYLPVFYDHRTFFGHVVFRDEHRRYRLSMPEHVWNEMGAPDRLQVMVKR